MKKELERLGFKLIDDSEIILYKKYDMYFSCIRACIFLQLLYSLRNSPRQETGWLLTAFMTVLTVYFMTVLKVHKHEIILNFFLPKSNSYMPFINFEKNFASFPSIFTRISMIEHFRGD